MQSVAKLPYVPSEPSTAGTPASSFANLPDALIATCILPHLAESLSDVVHFMRVDRRCCHLVREGMQRQRLQAERLLPQLAPVLPPSLILPRRLVQRAQDTQRALQPGGALAVEVNLNFTRCVVPTLGPKALRASIQYLQRQVPVDALAGREKNNWPVVGVPSFSQFARLSLSPSGRCGAYSICGAEVSTYWAFDDRPPCKLQLLGTPLRTSWCPRGELLALIRPGQLAYVTFPSHGIVEDPVYHFRQPTNAGASLTWSPDGNHLAVATAARLVILQRDGRLVHRQSLCSGGHGFQWSGPTTLVHGFRGGCLAPWRLGVDCVAVGRSDATYAWTLFSRRELSAIEKTEVHATRPAMAIFTGTHKLRQYRLVSGRAPMLTSDLQVSAQPWKLRQLNFSPTDVRYGLALALRGENGQVSLDLVDQAGDVMHHAYDDAADIAFAWIDQGHAVAVLLQQAQRTNFRVLAYSALDGLFLRQLDAGHGAMVEHESPIQAGAGGSLLMLRLDPGLRIINLAPPRQPFAYD